MFKQKFYSKSEVKGLETCENWTSPSISDNIKLNGLFACSGSHILVLVVIKS